MEMVSFDDVKALKPKQMHGDLHITSEGMYFLAFRKFDTLGFALQVNLGLIGMLLQQRSDRKRKEQMAQWRVSHGERYVNELVDELPGSWAVTVGEARIVKPRRMSFGLAIECADGRKFVIETTKDNARQMKEFVQRNNWPMKT